jgi:serine/threonine protein kinase
MIPTSHCGQHQHNHQHNQQQAPVNYYQGHGCDDDDNNNDGHGNGQKIRGEGAGGSRGGGDGDKQHQQGHGGGNNNNNNNKSSLGTQLELFLHRAGGGGGKQSGASGNNSRGRRNYPRSPSGGAASLASALSRHSVRSNASNGTHGTRGGNSFSCRSMLSQWSAVSTQSHNTNTMMSMVSGTSQSMAPSIMSGGAPHPPQPQEPTLLTDHELADLARKAQKSCQRKFAHSPNSDAAYAKLAGMAQFDFEYELQLGEILGQGQFGVVSEVRQIRIMPAHSNYQQQSEDGQAAQAQRGERELVASRTIRREGARGEGDCRYAVKVLRKQQCCDRLQFYNAYRDMAIEIHLLAALEHRHILKLRAISSNQTSNTNSTKSQSEQHGQQGYVIQPSSLFLMTDKLYGTLKEKYADWRILHKKLSKRLSGLHKILTGGSKAAAEFKERSRHLLEARLRCLRDVASAIQYLHSNNIIQRDLKPDNVGFDVRGDVKIFDFGLSTEVLPMEEAVYQNNKKDLCLYKLTGMTGSLRYMAPENYNRQPYNESIDIYALSIIIWQTLTLQHLYPNHDKAMIIELVVQRGNRPELGGVDKSASVSGGGGGGGGANAASNSASANSSGGGGGVGLTESMQKLLKNMWSVNVGNRPPAKYVWTKLQRELALVKEAKQLLIQVAEHTDEDENGGGGDGDADGDDCVEAGGGLQEQQQQQQQHTHNSNNNNRYDQRTRTAVESSAAARHRVRDHAPKQQPVADIPADANNNNNSNSNNNSNNNCDLDLMKKHQAQRKLRHSGRKDLLTEIEQALDMEMEQKMNINNNAAQAASATATASSSSSSSRIKQPHHPQQQQQQQQHQNTFSNNKRSVHMSAPLTTSTSTFDNFDNGSESESESDIDC